MPWTITRRSLAPFVYAGVGTANRTRIFPPEAFIGLATLAALQDRTLIVGYPTSGIHRHLDVSFGGEVRVNRRIGVKFEIRDRIESLGFAREARHFLETSGGRVFRF